MHPVFLHQYHCRLRAGPRPAHRWGAVFVRHHARNRLQHEATADAGLVLQVVTGLGTSARSYLPTDGTGLDEYVHGYRNG